MIGLKDFLEAIEYRITGGDQYLWECFGSNVRFIDSEQFGKFSASAVFDTVDQTVYFVAVHDEVKDVSYRMIHPSYIAAYCEECESNNVRFEIAFDDQEFIDLDCDEDMLEKLNAIVNELPYDDRVSLELNLSDDIILALALQAHKRDITLNDYICEIITDDLNRWLTFELD